LRSISSRIRRDPHRGCSRRISATATSTASAARAGHERGRCDWSASPASCPARYRATHRCTVARCTPARAATSTISAPSRTARTASRRCSTTDKTTSANPGLPSPDAPRKRRTRMAETGPVSQISWRRNVARQSTEDSPVPPDAVRTFFTSLKARGARRAPMARPLRESTTGRGNPMDVQCRRAGGPATPTGTPLLRCGHSALAPSAHGGRPPAAAPPTGPGASSRRHVPRARRSGTEPSFRRSSLEPGKITLKGGACGAVTRDSLRSPLTVIFPGTVRRLSEGWQGMNDQDDARRPVEPDSGPVRVRNGRVSSLAASGRSHRSMPVRHDHSRTRRRTTVRRTTTIPGTCTATCRSPITRPAGNPAIHPFSTRP
jgi:hypothetical protein